MVVVDTDPKLGEARPEETENIERILVPSRELMSFLHKEVQKGVQIDSRVYYFALGLDFRNK